MAIGVRPARAASGESIMNPRKTQEQIGLFPTLITAPAFGPHCEGRGEGRIEVVEVSVPGAGRP